MERNTIVRLYSMTKPVTAAAVMLLVERGMSFGEFLKKEFFEPLGMHDTGFSVSENKRDRLATVYEWTPNGLEHILRICQRKKQPF